MPSKPPGPPDGLLGLRHLSAMRTDLLAHYVDISCEYGDSVHYRVGPVGIYLFTHPEQNHEVLSAKAKSFKKPKRLRQVLGRWNGNGLLINEGESWRRQRRLVQKAFHPSKVQSYDGRFVKHAQRLAADCRGKEVNVFEHLSRLTLSAVAEALFGAEVEPIADRFTSEVAVLQEAAIADFLSAWIKPLWWPSGDRKKLRQAMQFLDELVMGMIAQRRKDPGDRGDLLSILLAAVDDEGDKQGMTDRQVRDESVNLLLGGNETTATALTWTLYLLAKNIAEQERLLAEVDAVLSERLATAADVPKLPLVEQALKESMRLYPPVYALSRTAIEDVEIGGYTVPRGAQVDLSFYVTHHDARWFPEPERFLPDRFAPESEDKLPQCAYLPFGAGPRACVGKGFAMSEAAVVLATILQHCRIELPTDHVPPKIEAQISLHPKGGMPLVFVDRHK
jgi:cytochrome P450